MDVETRELTVSLIATTADRLEAYAASTNAPLGNAADRAIRKGLDALAAERLASKGADEDALRAAATDALSGWRYIRQHHGDLYGVAWDRVENGLRDALPVPQPGDAGGE